DHNPVMDGSATMHAGGAAMADHAGHGDRHRRDVDRVGSRAAQRPEERSEIVREQLGLLERREVAAARHRGVALEVVEPLDPFARRMADVAGKLREAPVTQYSITLVSSSSSENRVWTSPWQSLQRSNFSTSQAASPIGESFSACAR